MVGSRAKKVAAFLVGFFCLFLSLIGLGVKFVKGNDNGNYSNVIGNNNVITWDDLKVDKNDLGLGLKGIRNGGTGVIVVDKNGNGDSLTVQGAIDMIPVHNIQRVKIFILPGIYKEKVIVPSSKPYVSLIGNISHASETVITWDNKASDRDSNGFELGTYRSASFYVESDYFCATGITFENTVDARLGGYGMQAVALRITGDKAMFYQVRVVGTQDTLLDDTGSHYFYQCYIEGTVDFIFGQARSLYEDCILHVTSREFGAIAAHHRNSEDDTGFSFLNCTINGRGHNLLGRAWGNYSRVVYSYCSMENVINPKGWSDWNAHYRRKTVVFGEYECRGKGANRRRRVRWAKSFSDEEAKPYLDKNFIYGDQWLRL